MGYDSFKVDFIGIGVDKAATSWIFNCLKEHPQICGSSRKEVHFFDKNFERGLEWYAKFFAHCADDKIKGEYTVSYFVHGSSAERMYSLFPQARLLLCLRHPLEKLISKYYFDRSRGKTSRSIDDYARNFPKEQLLYHQHLERFLQYYPREQIHIIIYKDLSEDPVNVVRGLYDYLGVDDSFLPSLIQEKRYATSMSMAKFMFVNRFLWKARGVVMKSKFSKLLVPFLKKSGVNWLANYIFKLNRRKKDRGKLEKKYPSPEQQEDIKNYCRQDIEQLEQLLQRDLSFWK